MLPFLIDTDYNTKKSPLLFAGLNQGEIIDDAEFSEGKNLSPTLLPAISPRSPMEVVMRIDKPQAIGVCYNNLVYCRDEKFYFNGDYKGDVSEGYKEFLDFNGKVLIMPDKKVYDYDEDSFDTLSEMPDLDYVTSYYNRVFGIRGSDVRASKLGEIDVWESFEGTALDSWAADVYSHGDFTGLVAYQDHLIFFKRNAIYELYGYIPEQFKIQDASTSIGCIDNRSIVEVGGILYFVGEKGVYAYQGGQPRPVSENLDEVYISASAITDGRTYYVNIYNGKEYKTYAYDTWNRAWTPYANMEIINFIRSNETIFALTKNGEIVLFNDSRDIKRFDGEEIALEWEDLFTREGLEEVNWTLTSKDYDDGVFEKKSLRRIRLKCKMDVGSSLRVFVRYNGDNWVLKKDFTHKGPKRDREIIMTIALRRASRYQIRLEGKGRALIYGEKEVIVGSEK